MWDAAVPVFSEQKPRETRCGNRKGNRCYYELARERENSLRFHLLESLYTCRVFAISCQLVAVVVPSVPLITEMIPHILSSLTSAGVTV